MRKPQNSLTQPKTWLTEPQKLSPLHRRYAELLDIVTHVQLPLQPFPYPTVRISERCFFGATKQIIVLTRKTYTHIEPTTCRHASGLKDGWRFSLAFYMFRLHLTVLKTWDLFIAAWKTFALTLRPESKFSTEIYVWMVQGRRKAGVEERKISSHVEMFCLPASHLSPSLFHFTVSVWFLVRQ